MFNLLFYHYLGIKSVIWINIISLLLPKSIFKMIIFVPILNICVFKKKLELILEVKVNKFQKLNFS